MFVRNISQILLPFYIIKLEITTKSLSFKQFSMDNNFYPQFLSLIKSSILLKVSK